VVWHNRDIWPLRHSFMIMRGNALVDVFLGGYLQHFGRGWSASYYPEGFTNCLVDYNRFRIRADTPWLNDGGEKLWSAAEIRKRYGWEIHGDGATYNPRT
jgi:hypothetical protein